jgi:hypothetical protein
MGERRGETPPQGPPEDDGLADANLPGLNEAFYRGAPHRILQQRHEVLLLLGARGADVDALLEGDNRWGSLMFSGRADLDAHDQRQRFLVSESIILQHHAAETLLRLYLAHEPIPRCPWLEISRERSFQRFKKRVAERFPCNAPSPENLDACATVFFGQPTPVMLTPVPEAEEWNAARTNVEAWLRHFARTYLDDADLYNAAKHGLAVLVGDASFSITSNAPDGSPRPDAEPFLQASGPSVEYLHTMLDEDGQKRWNRTTKWVDAEANAADIGIAIRLIAQLWRIAAARYVGAAVAEVDLLTAPRYNDLMAELAPESGHAVRTIHWPLLYVAEPTGDG